MRYQKRLLCFGLLSGLCLDLSRFTINLVYGDEWLVIMQMQGSRMTQKQDKQRMNEAGFGDNA